MSGVLAAQSMPSALHFPETLSASTVPYEQLILLPHCYIERNMCSALQATIWLSALTIFQDHVTVSGRGYLSQDSGPLSWG